MKELSIVIRKLFALSVMAKASHINSMSYAKHEAFGDFYSFVDKLADRVSEHCIGMGYIPGVELSMLETSGDTISYAMMTYSELYMIAEDKLEDEALCNMCAEFHEAIGKLKYMNRFP
jgi:hypothetical protein